MSDWAKRTPKILELSSFSWDQLLRRCTSSAPRSLPFTYDDVVLFLKENQLFFPQLRPKIIIIKETKSETQLPFKNLDKHLGT